MTLRVVPEGLAAASAVTDAIAARLAAARAAANSAITAIVPAASEPVSLTTATGFGTVASAHVAAATQGVDELGRAGIGVGESGKSYAAGDATAAAAYTVGL